jgi:hypothetical protein
LRGNEGRRSLLARRLQGLHAVSQMIEEYARHDGRADPLWKRINGATGH